jgi:hypothetical protein
MKPIILLASLAALVVAAAPVQAASFKLFAFKAPGALVSLSPQPLPPGGETSIIIVSGKGGLSSLNPQPLPPKEDYGMLNPQPIPPGGETSIIIVSGKSGVSSLNPQPIPPKEVFSFF